MTEFVKASSLKVNPANPRIIRDERYRKLVRSIAQFPKMLDVRGIVVDATGTIMGGNQRYRAVCDILKMPDAELADVLREHPDSLARWERIRDKKGHIPANWILHADNFTPDELRRFIIADNVEFGEHDWDMLANQWDAEDLADWGVDVPGFDADSAGGKEAQEDDYEIPEEIKTDIVAGDLFEIGPHRLLCGDSTKAEDVERLMDGKKADMSIADPPYGVAYVGKTKDALEIENDNLDEAQLEEINKMWFDGVDFAVKTGGYVLATVPPGPLLLIFALDWKRRGWLRQIMVWNKSQMVLGHSEYHYKHELILFGWKPGGERLKNADRTKTTVWDFDKPSANRDHPTMKPVALFAYAINNHSRHGEIVYDPFLGSGTTMVAAHQLGRKCYGMEIDCKYVEVIVRRMLEFDPQVEIKKNGQPYVREGVADANN
jgi:DNA modification methylase